MNIHRLGASSSRGYGILAELRHHGLSMVGLQESQHIDFTTDLIQTLGWRGYHSQCKKAAIVARASLQHDIIQNQAGWQDAKARAIRGIRPEAVPNKFRHTGLKRLPQALLHRAVPPLKRVGPTTQSRHRLRKAGRMTIMNRCSLEPRARFARA